MPFAIFIREWRAFTKRSPHWCFDFTSDEDLYSELQALCWALADEFEIEVAEGEEVIEVVGEAAGWLRPVEEVGHPYGIVMAEPEEEVEEEGDDIDLRIPPPKSQRVPWSTSGLKCRLPPPPSYLSEYFHVTEDERVALLVTEECLQEEMKRCGYHFVKDTYRIRSIIGMDRPFTGVKAIAAKHAAELESAPDEDLQGAVQRLAWDGEAFPYETLVKIFADGHGTRLPRGFLPETTRSRARLLIRQQERQEPAWRLVGRGEAEFAAARRLVGDKLARAQAALATVRSAGSVWIRLSSFADQVGISATTFRTALEAFPDARRGGHGEGSAKVEVHRSFLYWYLGYAWRS